MIPSPIEAAVPTLDARWIIALWVAIHGIRTGTEGGGELLLEADTVRAAAGSAILALASQLAPETAEAVMTALDKSLGTPAALSDAQIEEALKRFGIRLNEAGGVSVAGFGKICWR
ncbi:MAG: hypothetical protein JWO51_2396 [Rhodospirillales bacterium]|nr:hypothetical protein [Rhodospirillales bacterium]